MKTLITIMILFVVMFVSGCSNELPSSLPASPLTSTARVLPTDTVLSDPLSVLETTAPSIKNIFPTTVETIVVESTLIPYPSAKEQLIINRVIDNLSERMNVPAEQIKFVSLESVNWPDTSLGCLIPDTVVEDQIIPGYRIELTVNDLKFNYHTDTLEKMIICSGDMPFEIYHPP